MNQYSAADTVFLQEVANQIALAVENMKSYEQIARLSTLAEQAARRYRTLLEINNAIIINLTREALLHAVCEALQRVIPFDRAALTLYVPERDTLRILALEGDFSSDYFHPGLELDRKDSHPGWAFDHRRPLLRKDLEADRQFSSEHRLFAEGIRSIMILCYGWRPSTSRIERWLSRSCRIPGWESYRELGASRAVPR